MYLMRIKYNIKTRKLLGLSSVRHFLRYGCLVSIRLVIVCLRRHRLVLSLAEAPRRADFSHRALRIIRISCINFTEETEEKTIGSLRYQAVSEKIH
jgi:hypothetical protein